MPSIRRTLGAPGLLIIGVAVVIVAALIVAGQLLDDTAVPFDWTALLAAMAVSFTATGLLVLVGVPGHRVGRLLAAAGVTSGVSLLAASWQSWLPMAWLSKWTWWPPLGLVLLALLVFPDGRLPSRRWRPLAVILVAATAIATAGLALAALDHPRTLFTTIDPTLTPRARMLLAVAVAALAVVAIGALGVLWSLVRRWGRADGDTRRQIACLIPALIVLVLGVVLEASVLSLTPASLLIAVALPLAMTVAILRYRLYGLDRIVNRTTVWLVMSLLVIAGFVGIVAMIRELFVGSDTSNASLAATGLIAVTFEPLRRWVQRRVDRLLYGDRSDPYKVLVELLDLLRHTAAPHAVLPRLVQAVAESLRVPYVAVEVGDPLGGRVVAEHGEPTSTVEAFGMMTHGEHVGRLQVATRSPGSRFTAHERRLLENVALHAAVAAETTRLIRDLRHSRERLVMGREEERRRLRRDLHDGVGPALTGMAMQVRASRKLVAGETRACKILDTLAGDLQLCTVEVRRLVDQLRPPALDRGLEVALRNECQRFDGADLSVELRAEERLDGLPAAVEVAAYRIVAEALNNVARHSRAQTCKVAISRLQSLTIEITDDGVGIGSTAQRGVGLSSMRERTEELGGDCSISEALPHGTAIRVQLPIDAEA